MTVLREFRLICFNNPEVYRTDKPITVFYHQPEEIAYGPACWLWDYLRRSGSSGYFVPISGGADSSSTVALVGSMCQMVESISRGNQQTLADVRKVLGDRLLPIQHMTWLIEFCTLVTWLRRIARKIQKTGLKLFLNKLVIFINTNITELLVAVCAFDRKQPQFKVNGGSLSENRYKIFRHEPEWF